MSSFLCFAIIGYFNLNVALLCPCCQVLSLIPENHRNLFEYISEFCRTLLKHSDKNKLSAGLLGTLQNFGLTGAFSAMTLLVERQEGLKTEWWGAGVVICLQRGADLHMAQLMPLPLTVSCFSKIQIGLIPFWYQLTWVVPDKGPLNRCVCTGVVNIMQRNLYGKTT